MMLKVGVIGYGYWGPNLVRNFMACPDAVVTAVSDVLEDRLPPLRKLYPGLKTSCDSTELINDPSIDAIIIATPVSSHFELALAALRAGKHVLVEKPLASNSDQARQLIDEAESRDLVLMVDHTFVYTDAVRKMREVVKGKRWLLLSRWKNLEPRQRGVLNRLFQLNRRVLKAYLLKESLEQLWDYRYEGAMLNYLQKWVDQLRWQRLPSFQKLAAMLLKHLEGILNYCRTRVRFGVVEAINGNIRMLINRGRGYQNMRYLLLKAQRMVVTNTEYVAFQKTRKAA